MNKTLSLFIRYIIILALGLGNLFVFYLIFTPLTAGFVIFLLRIFDSAFLISRDTIIFNSITLTLVPACIAGAAYYFLSILILATPNIKLRTRLLILALSFSLFLIFNSLRIFFLAAVYGSGLFNFFHIFLWYFMSTVLVLGIWFLDVKIFKIKSIPVVDDVKFIYNKR
jgi:exosortase/archaeosortase family protein